jgi:hypothetical protein
MSSNHSIFEGDDIQELLENPNVKVGDTITLTTYNQEGTKKYLVVKSIKEISGYYDDEFYNSAQSKDDEGAAEAKGYDGEYGGKRRRTHKRRAHRKRRTLRRSRK